MKSEWKLNEVKPNEGWIIQWLNRRVSKQTETMRPDWLGCLIWFERKDVLAQWIPLNQIPTNNQSIPSRISFIPFHSHSRLVWIDFSCSLIEMNSPLQTVLHFNSSLKSKFKLREWNGLSSWKHKKKSTIQFNSKFDWIEIVLISEIL